MEVHSLTDDADVFTSNVYLVLGERNVLVDAGSMDGVVDEIREYTDSVDAVVLTHRHGDHVGELDSVVEAFDADVLSHVRGDVTLDDGDTVTIGDEEFDVVHTPGHSDDHLSFVSENVLFSGDVVVYNDEAFDDGSFGRTDMPGQSRETLIESIEHLLERMPPTVDEMYSGHGDPFHGDVGEVVERALERAERREPKYG
ncbi:MAG: MBL fold metallo-hydrolase [Halobacteria archaeon]|nr:MBL fold metallo-hydrolase [Halobacteria archaeon]